MGIELGYRVRSVVSLVATVAVLVAGCTSSTAGSSRAGSQAEPQAAPGGLLEALAMVRATESTRELVRYGDIGRTRELLAADRARFLGVHGHGLGRIRDYSAQIDDGLGFDPLALRAAVQAGGSADYSAIVWGDYDVAAVDDRLADHKISRTDRDGATEWTIDADGEWNRDDPLAGIVPTNEFHNLRTQPGSFAFSPYRDDLAWVTDPGQDTLDRDSSARALAECLGDVVAATVATKRFDAPLAVGVRAPEATDVSEVICVAPGSADQAARIRDQVRTLLDNGESPTTRAPWSQRVPNATVEVTGDAVVRVVAELDSNQAPGGILGMVETNEIKDLVESG